MKISIQVFDVSKAIERMQAFGISSAKIDEKHIDGVEFDTRHKELVRTWMTQEDEGWDMEELKETYPELFEVKLLAIVDDDNNILTESGWNLNEARLIFDEEQMELAKECLINLAPIEKWDSARIVTLVMVELPTPTE